jgi:hypothetical protein
VLVLSIRKPPLWMRWLLTILAFAVLIVAVIIAIHVVNNSDSSSSEQVAAVEADQETQIVVEEDQAPHSARLTRGASTRIALQHAIGADMRGRIRTEGIPGPLQGVRCAPVRTHHSGRQAFRCTARADAITYPFLGVVDGRTRALTWCKVDPPPEAGGPQEVPVSPRCRA